MRAILAALLVSAPAAAQTTLRADETFHRSAAAGQEMRVFTYGGYHRDCSPLPPPQAVLRTLPAHGSVSIRPAPAAIRMTREGGTPCIGITVPGTVVFYTPAAGFHGADQFDWTVTTVRATAHDAAVVDVQ